MTPPPSLLFDPNTSRGQALAALRRAFEEAGLDTPALDARILLGEALGIDRTRLALAPDAVIGAHAAEQLASFAQRRLGREPVARILGTAEFWSLPFALSPETLVPRPDTETVVELALALVGDREELRVLDLGTGSGCLLVALLHACPGASGLGIDLAEGALRTARRNADRNGVQERALFAASRWASAVAGRFDLVISNPPYIRTDDIAGLEPEAREHDPGLALAGGADGLAAYREILAEARRLLAAGGTLVVEIGFDQAEPVRDLAEACGLAPVEARRDLGGHLRALAFRVAPAGQKFTKWRGLADKPPKKPLLEPGRAANLPAGDRQRSGDFGGARHQSPPTGTRRYQPRVVRIENPPR